MNYYVSGRKKKKQPRGRTYTREFRPLQESTPYRRETPEIKSLNSSLHNCAKPETGYQQEVSSKYTVAIPYNKGAYQVIPVDGVKDIGR